MSDMITLIKSWLLRQRIRREINAAFRRVRWLQARIRRGAAIGS